MSRFTHYILHSKYPVSIGLFLLALIPRLPDLGRFLTADEFLWADRSRNFLAGLTNPAYRCTTVVETWEYAEGLACTLRTGHPGVTTMWTGSFGFVLRWLADGRPASLHDYVVAVSTNPLDPTFIAPERLGTVLITSLWVVAVYWLVRRLFGPVVALLLALLLALDPFHIALSRVIHHDALSTTFMTLSALGALIYWGDHAGRKWLVWSGLLAGFGFLSKSPALYLMPFIAVVGLWFFVADGRHKAQQQGGKRFDFQPTSFMRLILDGLLWFAIAVAVVFIFWPAMWVIPQETVETVFFIGSKYATGGHAKGNFFLGNVSKDPGALFYPVTWLYRTTPLIIIGLAGGMVTWFISRKRKEQNKENSSNIPQLSSFSRYLPLILIFILGYYLLMTIGEKKQERYFLPVYPWLSLMAAVGLISITSYLYSRFTHNTIGPAGQCITLYVAGSLVVVVLIINGILVATTFPYYFTYYNPLMGGIRSAAKTMTIGWGEGLDLAADYLNEYPESEQARVSSWYESTFAPFYHGPAISYSKEKGKVLAGDYAVFYINQTQRRFPDDILFEYYESRFEPIKTITLHGLDYAWIYPSLSVDHYIQDQTYTGIASLLAWQWADGNMSLVPGKPAPFALYWEYLGKQPDEHFFFRLVDAQDSVWVEGESRPIAAENPPVKDWREGEIIVERGTLTPPPGMPPGQYRLQIGFYTQASAVAEGELLFVVPEDEALITVSYAGRPQPYALPATANPLDLPLGNSLTLLGGRWPAEPVHTHGTLPLELYWRVEQPLPADTQLHLGLMDQTGEVRQAWFSLTLAETFNPAQTTWRPGDIIHTRWQLDLLPEVWPGEYRFELVSADDTTVTLPFGTLLIGNKE